MRVYVLVMVASRSAFLNRVKYNTVKRSVCFFLLFLDYHVLVVARVAYIVTSSKVSIKGFMA